MANGDLPGPVAAALNQGPPIGPGDPFYDRFLQEFKRKPNLDELEREMARRTLRAGYADVAPIQQPPALRARATEKPSFAEQRVLMHLSDPELFGPGVSPTQQAKVAAGRFTKALLGTAKGLLYDLPVAAANVVLGGPTGPNIPTYTPEERANQVGARGPESSTAKAAETLVGAANLPEQAKQLAATDPFSALGSLAGMGLAGEVYKVPGEVRGALAARRAATAAADAAARATPSPPKPPVSPLEAPTFRRRAGEVPKAAAPVLAGADLETPTYLRHEAAGQGVTVEQLEANNAAQAAAIAAERQRIQAGIPRGQGVAAEAAPTTEEADLLAAGIAKHGEPVETAVRRIIDAGHLDDLTAQRLGFSTEDADAFNGLMERLAEQTAPPPGEMPPQAESSVSPLAEVEELPRGSESDHLLPPPERRAPEILASEREPVSLQSESGSLSLPPLEEAADRVAPEGHTTRPETAAETLRSLAEADLLQPAAREGLPPSPTIAPDLDLPAPSGPATPSSRIPESSTSRGAEFGAPEPVQGTPSIAALPQGSPIQEMPPISRGAVPSRAVLPLAGAGLGAATGAAGDREHRLRGGLLGALAGTGAGAFLDALLARRAAGVPEERGVIPEAEPGPLPIGGAPGEIRAAGPTNIVPPEFLERTRKKFPAAVADAVAARAAEVVQEKGLNAARPVSWAETQAAADKLAIDPSEISKQRALRLNAAELKAVVDVVNRNEQRIIDLQSRLPNLPEDQLPEATRTLEALEKQNGDAVSVLLRASSQKGRDLNILKKLATDTQDPAVWLVKAQRMAGRPLTDEMKTEIRRILATGDRDHLARYVQSLRYETLTGGILRGWVMGLVSVPGILWKAAVGGVAHTVIERVKDPIAGTLDLLASGVANRIGEAGTSIRTKPVGGLSLNAATARGWLQGLKNVVTAVRGQKVVDPLFPAGSQVSAEMAARAHIPQEYIDPTAYWKVARPAAWIVNAYNRHFSRWVGVAHSAYFVPLTEGGTARSMIEEAWAATKNEGVKEGTPAFKKRFDWWVKNPTVEQQLRAIEYGSRMSLTHSTVLYEAARDVQRRLIQRGGVAGRVAGKVAAPIIKIPAAAASIATGYTPLGFLGGAADAATWARMIRQGVDASDLAPIQKRMVERLARATTGSGVILAGYLLAQHGLMTGAEPETPEQARVWKERGIGPYSLQIGKTQHWPVNMYPPAGFLLSFGASLYDIAHRMRTRTGAQPSLLERGVAAIAVPAKVALETPFLEGPQQMTAAVKQPEQQGPRYLRQLAQSVVPASGLTRTVARALDTTERAPEGVTQDIQAVIPGLSKGVPPKITALGDEQQHVGGWLALLGSAAPRPDRAAADPLLKELASQGAAPGIPTRLPTESPEDYTRRAKLTGEFLRFRLNGLVHTDEYAAAKQVEQEGRQAVEELQRRDPRYAQATVEQLLGAYYDYAKQGDPQFKTPRELIDDETRKVHSEAAAAFFGKHRGRTKLAPVP